MQPGWYPDPFSSGGYVRWWDGARWGVSQTAPAPAPESVTETSRPAPSAPAPHAWGDPPVPPPAPPSYAASAYGAPIDPAAAPFPLATWGQRAVAKIIDLLLQSILVLPFTLWVLWPAVRDFIATIPDDGSLPSDTSIAAFQSQVLALSFTLSLISTAISFVYEVPQNVRWGQTLGMRLLGIRIRPLAGDVPLTWTTATVRWGAYAAGALVAGAFWTLIDYLWPLWDKPWRQALHDKAAKTVVVPSR